MDPDGADLSEEQVNGAPFAVLAASGTSLSAMTVVDGKSSVRLVNLVLQGQHVAQDGVWIRNSDRVVFAQGSHWALVEDNEISGPGTSCSPSDPTIVCDCGRGITVAQDRDRGSHLLRTVATTSTQSTRKKEVIGFRDGMRIPNLFRVAGSENGPSVKRGGR